ncbi:MAG TPA: hypothetical protein ENN29_11450 [Candidatus Hydrogenedentes bacterium]|nr:hypothetical protein [Candidatus Hydrogenedentota bacterium]
MTQLIIICVGAALSYVVSRQIYDAYGGEITTSALAGYFSFEFVLLAVVFVFGRVGDKTLGGPEAAIGRLFLLLLVWMPMFRILSIGNGLWRE